MIGLYTGRGFPKAAEAGGWSQRGRQFRASCSSVTQDKAISRTFPLLSDDQARTLLALSDTVEVPWPLRDMAIFLYYRWIRLTAISYL